MSTFGLIEYKDASPQVRAIYDDIMATRRTDWINNFWKAIAHDPSLLKRTWEQPDYLWIISCLRDDHSSIGVTH